MTSAREVQDRVKGICDTRKIANTIYMVSSTRLKKSWKMLEETEPCFYTLQTLIRRVLHYIPEMEHRCFSTRADVKEEERTHDLITTTDDKGLVGAYNHSVSKLAEVWMTEHENHRLYVMSELGRQYFTGKSIPMKEEFHCTVQNSSMYRARLISIRVQEDYEQRLLDDVSILYTRMVSSLIMEAEMETLLPLKREALNDLVISAGIMQEEMQMLPNPSAIMSDIMPNYLTESMFGALVESFYSKQNARMMAMQSVSDNATAILSDLSIECSRVRQAATTQEATEVISGTRSQERKRR